MKLVQVKKENERYYTKEFVHGFNTGAKTQYEADMKDAVRHGQWEVDDIGIKVVATCSVCHNEIEMPTCLGKPIYSYCPACGALMADEVAE